MTDLAKDHDLEDVAAAMGMSVRWVRQQVKNGAAHQRYGHKIRFTTDQVEQLKSSHTKVPVEQSVTTGKKRTR